MIIIAMIIKLICKLFMGSNSSSSSLLLIDSCLFHLHRGEMAVSSVSSSNAGAKLLQN